MNDKVIPMLIKNYLEGGRVPWSPGYLFYDQLVTSNAVKDPDCLQRFRQRERLPEGFGVGLGERCVELPWVFAHLEMREERMLDAGSVLNYAHLLGHPLLRAKKLHILTLAPEVHCYWNRGISYLFDDLRDIPIRDDFYDTLICISTLEHVGFDNSRYTGTPTAEEPRQHAFIPAMKELRRVLKPDGQLLLTVPFGKYVNIGTQQVFDEPLLEDAIGAFDSDIQSRTFFKYTTHGWQIAECEECKECEYVDWNMRPPSLRSAEFPIQPDGAAAARAVACVALQKAKRRCQAPR